MFMSGRKWKTRKTMIPSPIHAICESLVSVKENTKKKWKKKEERKKKNRDTTQTKLNAPHIRYNIKILPQRLIIGNK